MGVGRVTGMGRGQGNRKKEGRGGEQVKKRWEELREVDRQLATRTSGVRSLTDNGSTLRTKQPTDNGSILQIRFQQTMSSTCLGVSYQQHCFCS